LLSAAGSAAVVFNRIKESWHLARKIRFLILTVIREILTLLTIFHSEIAKKTFFAADNAEQLNLPQVDDVVAPRSEDPKLVQLISN